MEGLNDGPTESVEATQADACGTPGPPGSTLGNDEGVQVSPADKGLAGKILDDLAKSPGGPEIDAEEWLGETSIFFRATNSHSVFAVLWFNN